MSRILRHVGYKDFQKTHRRCVDEQRFLSEKRKRIEIQEQIEKEKIVKLSAPLKSSWKTELFPEEVKVRETVEVVDEKKSKLEEKWKYDWRRSLLEQPEEELVEKVFEPIAFIKNKTISDSILDMFSKVSNWREELIDEGMSSKDFSHLYGYGISIFNVPITSTIQNPVQSTLAQDIVNASADATEYAFGPQFPGSYANTVGDPITSELSADEQPQSLSKVDAQARISLGDTDSALKTTALGDQDGPVLPADPWNYSPTEISGTSGSDYAKDLIIPINNANSSMQILSIRLEAGKEYVFKTLDIPTGSTIPGYTYLGSGNYRNNANTGLSVRTGFDSVLTLQNTSGDVVANNDDYFTGTYNRYVNSDPGDTFPQGPGGESEYYSGFGWTATPIQYAEYGDGNTSEWYYVTNSEIRYTPSETGTYYLGIRDYYSIGSSNDEYLGRLQITGTVPAATASSGRSRNSKTERTTDAYDLGAPVIAFDPNQQKRKKGEEGYMDIQVGDQRITRTYDADGNYTGADSGWQTDANYDAFKAGGGYAKMNQGLSYDQVVSLGNKNMAVQQQRIKSDPNYDAFKAGGGNAALAQGKTRDQVIAQGKTNLDTQQGGLGVLGGAATAAGALVGNFSTKDLTSRLSTRLPGYTIGKFENTGKGDHYTAPVLDSKGKPVIDQQTGKPIRIGGGIRGKDQWSNSAMGTLTNAINTIKRQLAPNVQTEPAKVTVTTTKTEKGTPTRTGTRSASRSQPAPTERSTIKSMPANMMGRRGGGGSGSSMIQPVEPFDYPTDPLSGYTWDKRSGRYIANSYTPYVNKIKGLIRENKKMKSFSQLKKELYPGQPSPNGFPDNQPPQMINGYHPEFGKKGNMYNRMDRATAMAMPLTKDPEIDAKIIAARQQPK